MEINYAPVIIPTLCRYEHFKQCIESLSRCTGAKHTEVYIGLDYPAKDAHWDGYNKITDYLGSCGDLGFKKLVVIRRERNYGVGRGGNYAKLRDYIYEKHDRIVVSEDDNVFSPNFLEYINEGLTKYKDDSNCTAVCGYNYKGVQSKRYNKNCYFSREYSAWGVGFWRDKHRAIIDGYVNREFASSIMSSWEKIWEIYKNEPRLLNTIILNLDCGRVFGDTMIVAYQYLNNKYSLFPTVSKIRNMGFDGSGTSIFEVDKSFMHQQIDSSRIFVCDKIDETSIIMMAADVRNHFKKSVFMNIVILIRSFIYYLTKKDILYLEAKRRNKPLFTKKHIVS